MLEYMLETALTAKLPELHMAVVAGIVAPGAGFEASGMIAAGKANGTRFLKCRQGR